METILKEIEQALRARLWYAAIALTLTLPDICASLESGPKARRDGQKSRYLRWCRKNLPDSSPITGALCWDLRSGVVHEGRYKHRGFDQVVFTTPDGAGVHNVCIETRTARLLILHIPLFCDEIIRCVQKWYAENKDHPNVAANLGNLVRVRKDGLTPWIKGPTTIG